MRKGALIGIEYTERKDDTDWMKRRMMRIAEIRWVLSCVIVLKEDTKSFHVLRGDSLEKENSCNWQTQLVLEHGRVFVCLSAPQGYCWSE